MQMKKPAWASMPVLDVRALTKNQVNLLGEAYDVLCEKELLPLAQLTTDPIRQQIDDALSKVLEIPAFGPIQELLGREPGLSAVDISPRIPESEIEPEDEEEPEQAVLF